MKVVRTINIDADLWIEAKKLPSISAVLNELLYNYITLNKQELNIKELEKKLKEKETEKKSIETEILLLNNKIEEAKNNVKKKEKQEEQVRKENIKKQEEIKKIKEEALSLDEINWFINNKDKPHSYYNADLNKDVSEEEFFIRKKVYEDKFKK